MRSSLQSLPRLRALLIVTVVSGIGVAPLLPAGAATAVPECVNAVNWLSLALLQDTSIEAPSEAVVDALQLAYTACGPGTNAVVPLATTGSCVASDYHVGDHAFTLTISAMGVSRPYVAAGKTIVKVAWSGAYTRLYETNAATHGFSGDNGGHGNIKIGGVSLPGSGWAEATCTSSGQPCAASGSATYSSAFRVHAAGSFRTCW